MYTGKAILKVMCYGIFSSFDIKRFKCLSLFARDGFVLDFSLENFKSRILTATAAAAPVTQSVVQCFLDCAQPVV